MAKGFSSDYVKKLNATHSGGIFLQAVEVTETISPLVIRRFVTHEKSIVFDGNTYEPLFMQWSGLSVSEGMSLPTAQVIVTSASDEIIEWAEVIDVRENDVVLQILHLDLLADVAAVDQIVLQIQSISGDPNGGLLAFALGLNFGLRDMIPRDVIKKDEFPGIPDTNAPILA